MPSSWKRVEIEAAIVSAHINTICVVFIIPQSFWTAASLADIIRRFKNTGKEIQNFPDCESIPRLPSFSTLISLIDVAIQLNDVGFQ